MNMKYMKKKTKRLLDFCYVKDCLYLKPFTCSFGQCSITILKLLKRIPHKIILIVMYGISAMAFVFLNCILCTYDDKLINFTRSGENYQNLHGYILQLASHFLTYSRR